jgi:hypothetical protein
MPCAQRRDGSGWLPPILSPRRALQGVVYGRLFCSTASWLSGRNILPGRMHTRTPSPLGRQSGNDCDALKARGPFDYGLPLSGTSQIVDAQDLACHGIEVAPANAKAPFDKYAAAPTGQPTRGTKPRDAAMTSRVTFWSLGTAVDCGEVELDYFEPWRGGGGARSALLYTACPSAVRPRLLVLIWSYQQPRSANPTGHSNR